MTTPRPPDHRRRRVPTSSSTAPGLDTADTPGRSTPPRPCKTPRPPSGRRRSLPATPATSPPSRCRGTSATSPPVTNGTGSRRIRATPSPHANTSSAGWPTTPSCSTAPTPSAVSRQHVGLDPGRRRQHLPHRPRQRRHPPENPPSCSPKPTTSSPTPPGGQPPPTTTPATPHGSHPSRHQVPSNVNPVEDVSLIRGAPPRTWLRVRAGCRRPRSRHEPGRFLRRHRGRGRYRARTWP